MRRAKQASVPAELAAVQRRLAKWRAKRRPGARIPARLWELAAQAAAKFGLNRTKTALQLDYYSLQHHLHCGIAARSRQTAQRSSQPTFVELAPVSLSPASLASLPLAGAAECVIELQDGAGASLRIALKGSPAADIAALARDFWSRG